MREGWSRRAVLRAGGAAAVWAGLRGARAAWALGEPSELDIAELQLPSGTVSRPEAWSRLLLELQQTTAVEVTPRAVQIEVGDPKLFAHPFAVLAGAGALPAVSEKGLELLSRYLAYGGFLFLDDTSGAASSGFDESVRRLVRQLYPTRPMGVLPSDHSVYRAFFLLKEPVGRQAVVRKLEGVSQGSMHPLIYFRDDLSGALDRGPDGRSRNVCTPGGEAQRREAIKLGINLVMYALTSNYKQDQAHVEELIREGRLE